MKTMQFRLRLVVPALCAAVWAGAAPDAAAQGAYPSKNVQIILPYSAGGSTDVIARAIAQRLGDIWGKNVIVENRPGASGMIGAEMASKAEPDGHTLLSTTSSYPATAAVRAKLPFDPAKAIVPVAMFARAPMLLAVHPSLPVKNVQELIALAKKNPGRLNYGSSGAGGNNHFSGSLFAAAAGVQMVHVPYKGIAPAVTALASGEVEIVISSSSALLPQINAGRVRILGVTSLEPSPLFPNLPSIAQSGVPGYSYELWWGLFAPAGIASERIGVINAAVNKVVASAEMKKFLDTQGVAGWPLPPAQLADLLPKEIARYKKAAQVAGIPPQ
ncbi:MAG: tripartite tricarboxylate transporter substrate binding protein [Betaproteobacteria bacterium]|nr:tripartite tricarboxylate transporter substrate binding protein [Betaproteobacteria bacterium]